MVYLSRRRNCILFVGKGNKLLKSDRGIKLESQHSTDVTGSLFLGKKGRLTGDANCDMHFLNNRSCT